MNDFQGTVQASLVIGSNALIQKPQRGIYNIVFPDNTIMDDIAPQIVVEEKSIDHMEITHHPIEQGAEISDHAFKLPAQVTVHMGWSNSPSDLMSSLINSVDPVTGVQSMVTGADIDQVRALYQKLLQLQSGKAIFDLYTGKRVYNNMMVKTIVQETDHRTEHALFVTVEFHQLIIVQVETVTLQASRQASPQKTASSVNKGHASLKPVTSSASTLPTGNFGG